MTTDANAPPSGLADHNTIAAEWEKFRKAIIPAHAHPVAVEASRMAFYAGAIVMHSLVRELPDDEAAAMALFATYYDEAMAFRPNLALAAQQAKNAPGHPQQAT